MAYKQVIQKLRTIYIDISIRCPLKRNTKALIKIAVSIAMLYLVVRMVDFAELSKTLARIPLWVVFTIVFGYMLGQIISAWKWWLIARAGQVDSSYWTALKSYFIGMYVNCFGLGIIGGDVVRGLLLADGKPVKAPAIASVVADRAHGLAVLALLGTIATLIFGLGTLAPVYSYILLVIGLCLVLGWFLGPIIVLKVVPPDNRFRQKIEEMNEVFPHKPSVILLVTIISAAFHLLHIALHAVMAYGVGATIGWSTLLVAIPFVNILSSLPISWNGLGVRENGYLFFLAAVLTREEALAFGALWLLGIIVTSAFGGIAAFMTKDFSVYSRTMANVAPEIN